MVKPHLQPQLPGRLQHRRDAAGATLADYEFDLSDPDARRAFDRAITGRALWMDVQGWFGGGSLERMRFSDLTLEDDLANNDATADAPRVIRHATALVI